MSCLLMADALLHNPNGVCQSVFGLNTVLEYQTQGIGGRLIETFIRLAREEYQKGIILTCKEEKIFYYAKVDFINKDESDSDHNGIKWY